MIERDSDQRPSDPRDEGEDHDEFERPIDAFRKTAAGSILAAGLMGVADALEGREKEEVAIVTEYSGDPPFTDPLVLRLDPDAPEDSIVWIRGVKDPSGE